MNASMVRDKASDLGPLRGHKAEIGCFSTQIRTHATQELVLGNFELILPCMHVKFITLRDRSIGED